MYHDKKFNFSQFWKFCVFNEHIFSCLIILSRFVSLPFSLCYLVKHVVLFLWINFIGIASVQKQSRGLTSVVGQMIRRWFIGQASCHEVLLEIVRDSPYVTENTNALRIPPDTFHPSSLIEQCHISPRHANTHTHTYLNTHTCLPSAQLRDVTCTRHEI